MLVAVPLSTGLSRGYWCSHTTEAPEVEAVSSTVLSVDVDLESVTGKPRVTQVPVTPVAEERATSMRPGVDRGLLGVARRRNQFRCGSYPPFPFNSYPPFPNTTVRPKGM